MGRASGFKPGVTEEDDVPFYLFGAARKAAIEARKLQKGEAKAASKPGNRKQNVAPGMGSDANIGKVTVGKKESKYQGGSEYGGLDVYAGGRGTQYFGPATNKPKRPSTVRDSMDIPVSPVVETAGIQGLPGGPSGVSTEREAARGATTFFGPTPEDAASVAEQTRMRKGLFGEDISQEDWDRMTQKNKEGSFWGQFKRGGRVKKAKKHSSGGKVSSASKRGDGCATKGKTKGRMV